MVHVNMIRPDQIKPNTPVIASNDAVFAVVDRIEGTDTIRLGKDSYGQHHFIPLCWVRAVTDKVHIDRPAGQALREWSTYPDHSRNHATRALTHLVGNTPPGTSDAEVVALDRGPDAPLTNERAPQPVLDDFKAGIVYVEATRDILASDIGTASAGDASAAETVRLASTSGSVT